MDVWDYILTGASKPDFNHADIEQFCSHQSLSRWCHSLDTGSQTQPTVVAAPSAESLAALDQETGPKKASPKKVASVVADVRKFKSPFLCIERLCVVC